MSINSAGQYTGNHKTWDHVGNMIPVVEHSEGIRPHGEFKPAAWLPVQFYDKYYEEWFVMLPGKMVAFDNDGRVVPAGYGISSPLDVTYSTDDVTAGVIDVRTGSALLSANTGTFPVSGVEDFMGGGETFAVSKPVGVVPYPYWQWAGDGTDNDDGFNPAGFRNHNHSLQHRVAILCDYVLELPLVPATLSAAESMEQASSGTNTRTFTAVDNLPLAANTQRTPLAWSEGAGAPGNVVTKFAVQKDNLTDVLAAGDWYIDLVAGVVTVFSTTMIGTTDYELTYSHYASAPTGSNVSKFASALGDLDAGDFLVCNADSNYIVTTTADFKDIMGQVLEIENVLGKDALDKVRTAYDPAIGTSAAGGLPAYAGQLDQMPGSATGGVPDKVHYAGAADKVVRINLVSR